MSTSESGLSSQSISRDHVPSEANEASRIKKAGGRISAHEGRKDSSVKMGKLRVWGENSDLPGLPITRSFGSGLASKLGIICDPGKCIQVINCFLEMLELDL